jgi:hypothetical protein
MHTVRLRLSPRNIRPLRTTPFRFGTRRRLFIAPPIPEAVRLSPNCFAQDVQVLRLNQAGQIGTSNGVRPFESVAS